MKSCAQIFSIGLSLVLFCLSALVGLATLALWFQASQFDKSSCHSFAESACEGWLIAGWVQILAPLGVILAILIAVVGLFPALFALTIWLVSKKKNSKVKIDSSAPNAAVRS